MSHLSLAHCNRLRRHLQKNACVLTCLGWVHVQSDHSEGKWMIAYLMLGLSGSRGMTWLEAVFAEEGRVSLGSLVSG